MCDIDVLLTMRFIYRYTFVHARMLIRISKLLFDHLYIDCCLRVDVGLFISNVFYVLIVRIMDA